jgi:uncharacterized protein YhaN
VEILRNSAALSSSIQKVIGLRHRAAEEMRQLRHQLDQYQRASDSLQRRIDRLKQKRASLQLEEANLLESLQVNGINNSFAIYRMHAVLFSSCGKSA